MSLRLDEPFRWGGAAKPPVALTPHDGMATAVKAATGWQGMFNGVNPMLGSVIRSPQKFMKEAQALYWESRWIGVAERTITRKVANLPVHIEDVNDDEVDDATPNPVLQQLRDLMEKPQAALPFADRQPGLGTGRGLRSIISRHMGLCGIAYVHPDQVDQNGLPLALIYVNPARVWPKTTKNGNLLGYAVDCVDDYGNGGIPFRPEELIPFYLEVPDWGTDVMGLVMAAAIKSRIVSAGDYHTLSVLNSGGRIAGLVSPKTGYMDDDDQYAQLERDFRNIAEDPQAAKRMTLLRGPVDFQQTAADPDHLELSALLSAGRDDTLVIWGVPPSQAGVPEARGMNSGEAGKHESEVLMTGPVHDRVVAIQETFQYELLDRWHAVGLDPQLVIEEPSFDDDGPSYTVAQSALNLPLTNNDRRELIGLDPLPDYGPDGEALGLAILLPSTITLWGQGPEPDGSFNNAPKPKPPPPPVASPFAPSVGPGVVVPPPGPAKAGFLGLRKSVDTRVVPAIRKSLKTFLAEQRTDIASRLRSASGRQLKDEAYWFRGDYWDRQLDKTLRPHLAGIAQTVTSRVTEVMGRAKAKPKLSPVTDTFTAEVEKYVLEQTGTRIGGINGTTRQAVKDAIRQGLDAGLTAQEIADAIEGIPAFDEARAEVIARTESMFAYNTSALTSYGSFGVEKVQAIDGDQDETCANRNGEVYGVDEAEAIEDHPNGTLDWAPIFGEAAA
jgi:hypothetical protein